MERPNRSIENCCQYIVDMSRQYSNGIYESVQESGTRRLAKEMETILDSLELNIRVLLDQYNIRPFYIKEKAFSSDLYKDDFTISLSDYEKIEEMTDEYCDKIAAYIKKAYSETEPDNGIDLLSLRTSISDIYRAASECIQIFRKNYEADTFCVEHNLRCRIHRIRYGMLAPGGDMRIMLLEEALEDASRQLEEYRREIEQLESQLEEYENQA